MFENKYIKQLRDVQARIRECGAMKAKMNPPRPSSSQVERNVIYWLEGAVNGMDMSLDKLCKLHFASQQEKTVEYIQMLGGILC